MAVDALNNFLLRESGRFAKDILQRTVHTDPMITLVKQGSWPAEMGYQITINEFERTLPASTYSNGGAITNPAYNSSYWTDVGTGNFDSTTENNCNPPKITLKMGNTPRTFNLQHMALESQLLCATDLLTAFSGPRQLEAVKENLAVNTQFILAEKFRRDYTYLCANRVVCTVNGNITSTTSSGANASFNDAGTLQTAGVTAPASITPELLQDWSDRLQLNGASRGALSMEDGAPVHGLICSNKTSDYIKRQSEWRDDFRWNAGRVNELLQALQVRTPPILGYQHIKTPVAPRWNYTGGAWVKVEPYYVKSATTGFKIEENPDYRTAAWEDTLVFHPDLMEVVWPGSVGNSGGTAFTPVNYRGVWGWRNIPDRDLNPDGDVGYFRGRFMLGAMPKYTNFGVVIRHARCDFSPLYAACNA